MTNHTINPDLFAALLGRLSAGNQGVTNELNKLLDELPSEAKDACYRMGQKFGVDTDLLSTCGLSHSDSGELLTADQILKNVWPEPVWAIPQYLPVGLGILAGAPKVGKSWLALQIAQAVAAGGFVLGTRVERGPVLYLALEDPARRLQERMKKQGWPLGLEADFLPVGSFQERIGDLRNGGHEKLARMIEHRGYRFVAIDTFSRSIRGDQSDVGEMTEWLSPLQETAHARNCVVLLIDHHKKKNGFENDVIADILGSTAKGAMADTIMGFYKERGKAGAKLVITGREVEEKTVELRWDWLTGCWQLDTTSQELTEIRIEILEILRQIGPAGPTEIAKATGRRKGAVYNDLIELEKRGKVHRIGERWDLLDVSEQSPTE